TDVPFGLKHQAVNGRGETHGQIGILGNQLFRLTDEIEFLLAQAQDGICSKRQRRHPSQQLDENCPQFRIKILCLCVEIVETRPQLESDHGKTLFLAYCCGLNELIDHRSKPALRCLRSTIEPGQGSDITAPLSRWVI